MAELADAHGLGPCPEKGGGSSPLIRTKKNMSKHELFTTREHSDPKLLIPTGNNPIGSKFLYNDQLPYARDRIIDSLRYKSSITGREYSDYQRMREEERLYIADQRRTMSDRSYKDIWIQQ